MMTKNLSRERKITKLKSCQGDFVVTDRTNERQKERKKKQFL
jgi:hypothetical protein